MYNVIPSLFLRIPRKKDKCGQFIKILNRFFIPAFDVIFQSMLQALLKHHKVDYEEEDTLQDEV